MRTAIAVSGPGEASAAEIALAREIGAAIAGRGWVLLTGGRNAGAMEAASEGAAAGGGLVVGILPDERAGASAHLHIGIVTATGSGRNNVLVLSADAVVAIGARSAGTVSEIALAVKGGTPVIVVAADPESRAFLSRFTGVMFAADAREALESLERIVGKA